MTSAKQIKQVYRPLMERDACLAQIGNGYLWIRPIHHVALRVLIERSSDKDICSAQWTMLAIFNPDTDVLKFIGYSGHLHRPSSSAGRYWRWSDPTMIDDMISAIEFDALPRLRKIDSLEAFWAVYGSSSDLTAQQLPENRMIFHIALGELDQARAIWNDLEPRFRQNRYPNDFWLQNRRDKILAVADPLLAGDRPALAKILHGWESDNVRGTKIEPYWEPTPFPLETAPG